MTRRPAPARRSILVRRSSPFLVLAHVVRRGMAENWAARVLAVVALAVAAGFALATTVALGSVERGLGSSALDTATGADLRRPRSDHDLHPARGGPIGGRRRCVGQPGRDATGQLGGQPDQRPGRHPARRRPGHRGGLLAGTTFATWSDRLEVRVVKGSAPTQPGQVVLSSRTASELSAKIGDVIAVGGAGELRPLEVVGVVDAKAALGRTVLGAAEDVQRVLGRFDQFDALFVATNGPVDPAELGDRNGRGRDPGRPSGQPTRRAGDRGQAGPPGAPDRDGGGAGRCAGRALCDVAPGGGDPPPRSTRSCERSVPLGDNLRLAVVADALWTSVAAGLLAPLVAPPDAAVAQRHAWPARSSRDPSECTRPHRVSPVGAVDRAGHGAPGLDSPGSSRGPPLTGRCDHRPSDRRSTPYPDGRARRRAVRSGDRSIPAGRPGPDRPTRALGGAAAASCRSSSRSAPCSD